MVAAGVKIASPLPAQNGRLERPRTAAVDRIEWTDPKETSVSVAPTQQIYQYREVDSLEEVNRLAAEEGFDLFQAVALDGQLRFVVRRVRDSELGRRVGFAGSASGH